MRKVSGRKSLLRSESIGDGIETNGCRLRCVAGQPCVMEVRVVKPVAKTVSFPVSAEVEDYYRCRQMPCYFRDAKDAQDKAVAMKREVATKVLRELTSLALGSSRPAKACITRYMQRQPGHDEGRTTGGETLRCTRK